MATRPPPPRRPVPAATPLAEVAAALNPPLETLPTAPARVVTDDAAQAQFWADWHLSGRAVALQLWQLAEHCAAGILARYNRDREFAALCEAHLARSRDLLIQRSDALYGAVVDRLRAGLAAPDLSVAQLVDALEAVARVTGHHKVDMAKASASASASAPGKGGPTISVPVILTQPRMEDTARGTDPPAESSAAADND